VPELQLNSEHRALYNNDRALQEPHSRQTSEPPSTDRDTMDTELLSLEQEHRQRGSVPGPIARTQPPPPYNAAKFADQYEGPYKCEDGAKHRLRRFLLFCLAVDHEAINLIPATDRLQRREWLLSLQMGSEIMAAGYNKKDKSWPATSQIWETVFFPALAVKIPTGTHENRTRGRAREAKAKKVQKARGQGEVLALRGDICTYSTSPESDNPRSVANRYDSPSRRRQPHRPRVLFTLTLSHSEPLETNLSNVFINPI